MTYVDAFWNRDRNAIEVVERVNGKRKFNSYPTRFLVGYPSERGRHTSIFGTRLDVFETNKWEEFQRELRVIPRDQQFESDINPIFRCFYDNYKNAPLPDLNVAFWDIEVDFHPEKGFSNTEEAFNPITAISVYCSWLDSNFTLALKPRSLSHDQALAITEKFDNTVLCSSEGELLDAFLSIVDDADVITGWNCLDLNSYIFCDDRIRSLSSVQTGQQLPGDRRVINKHLSGLKKKNILSTVHGHTLSISDEHRIPVFVKQRDQYKNPRSLLKTAQDRTVAEIKQLIHTHDVYVELNLHHNTRPDLSFRQLILENWDLVFDMGLDFVIKDPSMIKHLQSELGYKSENYCLTYQKARNRLDKQLLIDYFRSQSQHRMMFNRGRRGFIVDVDQPIPLAALQLLGLIYTDGFYSNHDRSFVISNTNPGIHQKYQQTVETLGLAGKWRPKQQDQCSYLAFAGSCMIGLLMPLIYTKSEKYTKKLNVELISCLSQQQFAALISGMIDGDGSVTQWDTSICNYNDDIDSLNVLFQWNGVFTTSYANHVRIPFVSVNQPFLNLIDLGHINKRLLLCQRSIRHSENCSNKKLNKFILDHNRVLIKIKQVQETQEWVPMGDIETSNHYFVCNGIRVHNSSAYDVPYLHNRIVQTLGKEHTRRMCLWNKFPKKREYQMYGKTQTTYDLFGRVHLDYLDLYRKHTYHEMHSYRLDFVGEYEVGEKKVAYEGSLDKLYNEDFEKFIAYNRQDVMLLVKIDRKLKFIELSNALAHENGVLLPTTMGSVLLIDNAITNEAHDLGLLIPARQRSAPAAVTTEDDEDSEPQGIVGAYVADPVKGIHEWIGGVDINSLYPSAIRSLNMSKETVVGQIRPIQTDQLIARRVKQEKKSFADAWNEQFGTLEYNQLINREMVMLTVDFEDGNTVELTADELYQWIFENPNRQLIVSANGTIFDGSRQGVVPGLLARWYSERKLLQKTYRQWDSLVSGIPISADLNQLLSNS